VPSAARDRHQLEQYYSTASLSLMLFSAFQAKLRTSLPRSADDSAIAPSKHFTYCSTYMAWLLTSVPHACDFGRSICAWHC
jgi:hypothetical protein